MLQWCHSTEYKMSQNITLSSKHIFKDGQVARYASVWQKSWLRSESSNRSSNTWRWLFIIITIVDILVYCTKDNVLWMIVIQEVVCQKSGSLIYSSLLGITIILAADDDDDDNDHDDDDHDGDDNDDGDDDDEDGGVFLFKLEILTLDNRRAPSSYPV